ncbi:cytochrome c oxidase assembly protein [Litorimonas sp.]|jgi:cytochrome c oxidase assembly protein subunit 11|uniref:cytochrome c oxidase assembly protein n=1 Tax=Litorimonas sp. TaxID=1892381 RepID=UPI003A855CAC
MNSNKKTLLILIAVGFGMLALGMSSSKIYNTFCKITGYGGTTQQAEENLSEVIDRKVTIKFDSNVADNLPWVFKPQQKEMDVQLGQSGLAYYTVKNTGTEPIIGVANFNVTPIKAGPFFVKTDCFCFTEQRVEPGEELPLPVLFFIDPQLDEDKRMDEVKEITLSYTFFESDATAQLDTQTTGSNAEKTLN